MAEETSVFDPFNLTEPIDIVAVEFLTAQSKTAKQAVARIAWRMSGNLSRPTREEYDFVFDALQRRGQRIEDAKRDAIVAQLGHPST